MHPLAIVKYSDVKTFGLQQILDPLLSDLSFLGFDLCHDGVTHHATMAVLGVVRDNLSLHRVGGFKCCFSKDLLNLLSILRGAEETVKRVNVLSAVWMDTQESQVVAEEVNPASSKLLYGVKAKALLLALPGFDMSVFRMRCTMCWKAALHLC